MTVSKTCRWRVLFCNVAMCDTVVGNNIIMTIHTYKYICMHLWCNYFQSPHSSRVYGPFLTSWVFSGTVLDKVVSESHLHWEFGDFLPLLWLLSLYMQSRKYYSACSHWDLKANDVVLHIFHGGVQRLSMGSLHWPLVLLTHISEWVITPTTVWAL